MIIIYRENVLPACFLVAALCCVRRVKGVDTVGECSSLFLYDDNDLGQLIYTRGELLGVVM